MFRLRVVALILMFLPGSEMAYGKNSPDWVTPGKFKDIAPHPRLFVSKEQIERMVDGRGERYAEAYDEVAKAAETGVMDVDQPMKGISPFDRGFKIQGRLTALAIQWHRTGERRYLEAALKTVEGMESWLKPEYDYYSLRHGQYIAAIAVTYDLLHNDMTSEERAGFVEFARDNCIRPFLGVTGRRGVAGERGSWWQYIISNWNPVCNSGPGMLALAMYEDLPEAQTVIDRVDASFKPIIEYLQETEGGWVEGLGYWNWTIHYMSLFYMSFERTTGTKHEAFRSDGFRDTLTFGSYFAPHAEACGFGDNQHGNISDSLLAAAGHLDYEEILKALQDYRRRYELARERKRELRGLKPRNTKAKADNKEKVFNISYGVPQKLLIEPDPVQGLSSAVITNMVKIYPKQGWSMVADRWPKPGVYASIRGGELGGAHTHSDLLSWNGVMGIERMICTVNKAGYYDTSWQQRAWEIYERNAASENTIFIGGLSAYTGRRRGRSGGAKTERIKLPSGAAVRLDATKAFWLTRKNPALVCRVFAVLGNKGLLVIDRIKGRGSNPVEVRTHTEKKATFGQSDVLLEGEFEKARITFACDRPALLRRATAMLTDARAEPPTVMRWQSKDRVKDITMASVLSRGADPVEVKLKTGRESVKVIVKGSNWSETVVLDGNLMPLR